MDYNQERLHGELGSLTSAEFAKGQKQTNQPGKTWAPLSRLGTSVCVELDPVVVQEVHYDAHLIFSEIAGLKSQKGEMTATSVATLSFLITRSALMRAFLRALAK